MKIDQSILVVDDDLAHRMMLKKLLGGWGYQVSKLMTARLRLKKYAKHLLI